MSLYFWIFHLVKTANAIWRDFVTDGVPASGKWPPHKPEIREWGTWLESFITAFVSNGGLVKTSKASLDSDLAHGADSMAWVIGDATTANNGIYRKVGASGSGSWTRVADLPYSFIRLNDAGAGTANAVVATSSLPLPSSPSAALLVMNVFEANTGPVTIAANGAAAKALVTNTGNALASGYLQAGMLIAFLDTGTNYRLLTDVVSSAIVAAAEAAQVAAEDAADRAEAAVPNAFPLTLVALKALDTATIASAYLKEAGKVGQFSRVAVADWASLIAADTYEAVIAVSTNDPTYAWLRIDGGWAIGGGVDLTWFGIVYDNQSAAAQNALRLQAAFNLGYPIKGWDGTVYLDLSKSVTLEGGITRCAATIPTKTVVRGIWSRSKFKIKDNESTISAPLYWNMFAVNGLIQDIDISGVTFDLNGANNRISPTKTCTISNANPAVITANAHGAFVGQIVRFTTTGALPTGLTAGVGYYVVSVTTNTFQVSSTPGGTPVATSSAGSGTHTVKIFNHYNCAAIMVSGRVATAGADARIVNGKINNNIILNSPGVTALALGQQEGSGLKSFNVEVCNNYVSNCGMDTSDHSSFYLWGDYIKCNDNFFQFSSVSTGLDSPVVAAELHGGNISFCNNDVVNYCQGTWICGDWDAAVEDCTLTGNRMVVSWLGHGTWSLGGLSAGLRRVVITDNTIFVASGALLHPALSVFPKRAVHIDNAVGTMQDFTVQGNICTTADTVSNVGIVVSAGSGAVIANADVANNIIRGFSVGVGVGFDALGNLFNIKVVENTISDIRTTTAVPSLTRGIKVTGNNGLISIRANKIGSGLSAQANHPNVGIAVAGSIEHLDMDDNGVVGAVTRISDTATVSGRRIGVEACTFSALPAQSTWKIGDVAYAGPAAIFEAGTAGSRYVNNGWRRITDGTGNVLNTDWKEMRTLTGA